MIVHPIHLQFHYRKQQKHHLTLLGKSHALKRHIGEELIKPAAISMVRMVCADDIANKLELIPLSDNTVKRRIDLMSENILKQLVHQVITANK